ncbi:MAG: DUF6522 family protein [Rhodospirillales bacterium]
MSQLPRTAVTVADGDITIAAEILAPGLGLSVSALKANMAKGLVTSVSETGQGEDAGRRRLTFRYRAKVWRVVVEPDGRLVESPPPSAKPAKKRSVLLDLGRDEA